MMADGVCNAVIENPEIYKEGSLLFLRADLRISKSAFYDMGSICINGSKCRGLELIYDLMEVAGVEKWSEVHGRPCRIVIEDGWVARLMNFLDDAVVCEIRTSKVGE